MVCGKRTFNSLDNLRVDFESLLGSVLGVDFESLLRSVLRVDFESLIESVLEKTTWQVLSSVYGLVRNVRIHFNF